MRSQTTDPETEAAWGPRASPLCPGPPPPGARHWGWPVTPDDPFRPPNSPPSHPVCFNKGRRWTVCTFKLPSTKTVAPFSHALRLVSRVGKPPRVPSVGLCASWRSFAVGGEQRRDTANPAGPARHASAGRRLNPRHPSLCHRSSRCLLHPSDGGWGQRLSPAAAEEDTKTEWPELAKGQRFASRWRRKGRKKRQSWQEVFWQRYENSSFAFSPQT